MGKTIRVEIITPDRLLKAADVSMVVARATDGDIGILPNHAPLITSLAIWPVKLKYEEAPDEYIAICGGFLEVSDNKITILTPVGELPTEIDLARAEAAKARAEERLKRHDESIDISRAEIALKRALARLKAVAMSKLHMK